MSITYRVGSLDDTVKVMQFLRKHYYPEEPLTIASEPRLQAVEDEQFSASTLETGLSMLAIESSPDGLEQIVGVILAGPKYPSEADDMMDEANLAESSKWADILRFLAYLEKRSNIYQRYNVDKAVSIYALGVSSNCRGQSIGVHLMEKCMQRSKELGYALVTADCTSIYSGRAAEKAGMECIGSVAFAEYRYGGRQPFEPPHPHYYVKTYAKLLKG